MFTNLWQWAFLFFVAVIPLLVVGKVILQAHTVAVGGPRRAITYLVGFAATGVAMLLVIVWLWGQGKSMLVETVAQDQAVLTANAAGLELAGHLDNASAAATGLIASASGAVGGAVNGASSNVSLSGLTDLFTGGSNAPIVLPTPLGLPVPEATATPIMVAASVTMPTGGAEKDWKQYTVKPGDSMGDIARRYGISLSALCGMNAATVPNCSVIRPNQVVKLPTTANGTTVREVVQVAKPAAPNRPVPTQVIPVAARKTHTIQPGETVYGIAAKLGTDVYSLCVANRPVLGDNCDNVVASAVVYAP